MSPSKKPVIEVPKSSLDFIVDKLGKQIEVDYKRNLDDSRIPIVIGVLSGSTIFLADLVRKIDRQLEIDFIRVSSYINNTKVSTPRLISEPTTSVVDRDILIVEDIVDTGDTIKFLRNYFKSAGARTIKVVSLFKKRSVTSKIDYFGFEVADDKFLVGYGLDNCKVDRNLPDVWSLTH